MKTYGQFIEQLDDRPVVFAFGRFNPPTIGHGVLVNAVLKVAKKERADHVIFASKTQDKKKNPLDVNKKVDYLKLMFPKAKFQAASNDIRTFMEAATALNSDYNRLIMIAGSDRVADFTKLLNTYNQDLYDFREIQVISAGQRDPDAEGASGMSASKMRSIAAEGDFDSFKKGVPNEMREVDAKRLMNDVRRGLGLPVLKEQVKPIDQFREQYFRGDIFLEGEEVIVDDCVMKIKKRGTNYLILEDPTGATTVKWPHEVTQRK